MDNEEIELNLICLQSPIDQFIDLIIPIWWCGGLNCNYSMRGYLNGPSSAAAAATSAMDKFHNRFHYLMFCRKTQHNVERLLCVQSCISLGLKLHSSGGRGFHISLAALLCLIRLSRPTIISYKLQLVIDVVSIYATGHRGMLYLAHIY